MRERSWILDSGSEFLEYGSDLRFLGSGYWNGRYKMHMQDRIARYGRKI